MSSSITLPYRPGVGMMLANRENRIFVAKRIDMTSEAWQMPQGGIDEGEPPLSAALRELKEETGIAQAEVLAEHPEWLTYDLPEEIIPRIWGGKYRGQRQKWFALRFRGEDSDINIRTDHPEFSEWRWASLEELPSLIVPFKRDLYARLVKDLGKAFLP